MELLDVKSELEKKLEIALSDRDALVKYFRKKYGQDQKERLQEVDAKMKGLREGVILSRSRHAQEGCSYDKRGACGHSRAAQV